MEKIFFDSWDSVFRTLIITTLAYLLLIVLLRSSGKRTLSKMNAFDLIVTIALGSTLATVILNKNVALIDGILAFFLLIYFQYLITAWSARSDKVSNIIKSTPSLLVYKGMMLEDMMKKERIHQDEIMSVVRGHGLNSVKEADAIILETDGSMTLIRHIDSVSTGALEKVLKPDLPG